MPMSPSLLRPRASGATHPEALNWATRVTTNGGTVSSTTLAAVSKFCADIDAAGIRDRFYRLNLFCGDNLSAALVPLYRAASLTATQLGAAADNGINFVSADYQETGSSSGLTKSTTASNKVIATGLLINTLPQVETMHLAVSIRQFIAQGFAAGTNGSGFVSSMFLVSSGFVSGGAGNEWGAFSVSPPSNLVFSRTSSTSGVAYTNGTAYATNSATVTSNQSDTRGYAVFGIGNSANGGVNASGAMRANSYSFGAGMSAAQVAAYNNALSAFNSALNRT